MIKYTVISEASNIKNLDNHKFMSQRIIPSVNKYMHVNIIQKN